MDNPGVDPVAPGDVVVEDGEPQTPARASHIRSADAKHLVFDASHVYFPSPLAYQVLDSPEVYWDVMYIYDQLKEKCQEKRKSSRFIKDLKAFAHSKEYLGSKSIHVRDLSVRQAVSKH